MSNIDWTEFQGTSSADYPDRFKFEAVGDSISGTLTDIKVATMPDGTRIPALNIATDEGTVCSLLASQRGLQALLAEHRPCVGDRLAIVHTGLGDPKPGKSPAKLFDLKIKRADATTAAAASMGLTKPTAADLI